MTKSHLQILPSDPHELVKWIATYDATGKGQKREGGGGNGCATAVTPGRGSGGAAGERDKRKY